MVAKHVNYAVSCSVWEQMGKPARLTPHALQKQLVDGKMFGRKSKLGFYSYQTEHPVPAVAVKRATFELPKDLFDAVRRVCAKGSSAEASITEQYIFARVLATIVNEGAHALEEGVASAADIDIAMRKGTNYPKGPLEWADAIGRHTVAGLLRTMDEMAGDGRFAPSAALA
jgi:3-hydroxybutyryl-CoA dehydrogenase